MKSRSTPLTCHPTLPSRSALVAPYDSFDPEPFTLGVRRFRQQQEQQEQLDHPFHYAKVCKYANDTSGTRPLPRPLCQSYHSFLSMPLPLFLSISLSDARCRCTQFSQVAAPSQIHSFITIIDSLYLLIHNFSPFFSFFLFLNSKFGYLFSGLCFNSFIRH